MLFASKLEFAFLAVSTRYRFDRSVIALSIMRIMVSNRSLADDARSFCALSNASIISWDWAESSAFAISRRAFNVFFVSVSGFRQMPHDLLQISPTKTD